MIFYDKLVLKEIEKVIVLFLNLGVMLMNDGNIICVIMFEFIEEWCKEYVKIVCIKGEDVKVVICNVWCKVKDDFDVFNKEVGEDDIVCVEKEFDVFIKVYVDGIDDVLKCKEVELFEI